MSTDAKTENTEEQAIPTCGFKIAPDFRQELITFLEERPYAESDFFLTNMFEIEDKNPYFSEAAIKQLIGYIGTCPRRLAKPLIEKFADSALVAKFEFQPKQPDQKLEDAN